MSNPREITKPTEGSEDTSHLFSGLCVCVHIFPQSMWFKALQYLFLNSKEILDQEFEGSNAKVLA